MFLTNFFIHSRGLWKHDYTFTFVLLQFYANAFVMYDFFYKPTWLYDHLKKRQSLLSEPWSTQFDVLITFSPTSMEYP